MVRFAYLASICVAVISSSVHFAGGGRIRDCPSASLSCEKSKDSEYVCQVTTPQSSRKPPRFKWSVTGGKVLDAAVGGNGAEAMNAVELQPEDYEDTTDWRTFGFRYRL